MQRVFFRNLILLVTLNVLIKPLWILGIDRGVQNAVGADVYGSYFVLLNLSFLTQILLDLGISNFNNRQIAREQNLLQNYFPNILAIKLLLSVAYIFLTLLLGWMLNYSSHLMHWLLLICFNQSLASVIVYVRTNISALHHFKVDSILSVLDKALMIILCGLLLSVPVFKQDFKIEWFIYTQTFSYIVTLAVAIIYVIKFSGRLRLKFSTEVTLSLFKKAFPFGLLIALMAIYSRMDAVMIEKLLPETGEEQAGIYASAYRLLDALNQFGYLFAALLLPIFSRMLSKNESVEKLVRTSFTVIFIGAWVSCLCLSFFSGELMPLLYHEANQYSASILTTLIFCFMGTATVYIFGTLLTARGNLYQLSLISLVAVVCNVLMNLLLIPKFGAWGAANASTTTQLLIASLNFLLAWKIFKWKINGPLILRLMLFCFSTYGLFYFITSLNKPWLMMLMIGAVSSVLIAWLLRLIAVKQFTQFLRTESASSSG